MASETYLLSVNAGSSSVKLQLFELDPATGGPRPLLKSTIANLSSPPAKFTYKNLLEKDSSANVSSKDVEEIKSDTDAFDYFLEYMNKDSHFKKGPTITHVCHRVVHGGDLGEKGPAVVDDKVLEELDEVTTLAPLHNGPAIHILRSIIKTLPNVKNIAFFDTSFHNSLPDFIRTFPIDQTIAKKKKLRKYGFHGISYKWILKNTAKHLNKEEKDVSIIALHLGSGASICAIKNGKSYDTTMGLTPLAGLPGGTRSGSVDPSLIFHYTTHPSSWDELPPSVKLSHAENILNYKAGFKALTGTSNFGEILAKDPQTPETKLTVNIFLDRVLNYVGMYWLKLNGGRGGVDAIVFAAGIGENSPEFRKLVVDGCYGLGGPFDGIDAKKNEDVGKEDGSVFDIGDGKGSIRLLVCMTNEERQMIEEVLADENLRTPN